MISDKIKWDFFQAIAVSVVLDANEIHREKTVWEQNKNATCCFEQILKSQNNSCKATYLPSHKPSKTNEVGEVKTNSLTKFSYGFRHKDVGWLYGH